MRKISTTCAARTLDVTATSIIATQMSHQAAVAQKHTAGAADAARAFKIMKELRTGEAGSSSEQRYKTWGREANRLHKLLKSYIIKDVAVAMPLTRGGHCSNYEFSIILPVSERFLSHIWSQSISRVFMF